MTKKPEIISAETIAHTRIFTVERLHLRFANGQERDYERMMGRAKSAVLVIPLLDAETILLIREYAAGVDDYVLAFPKGAMDQEEDILKCANRELMEEVGFAAHRLTHLTSVSTSPGYLQSIMHLILAEDLYPQTAIGDEPEPLEIVPWKLNNMDELLARSDFHEARSIAALFLLERHLKTHRPLQETEVS